MPQTEKPVSAPTMEQLCELGRLKGAVDVDCSQLYSLVLEMFGEQDNRTLRAEQIGAAVKRFEWALERAPNSIGQPA